MKILKRAMVLFFCFLFFSNGSISAFATESVSGNDTEVETAGAAAAEQLMAAESVEKMYALVLNLMQNDSDALLALTADEIEALRERINDLDPEGDDADTQDLLDTLAVLPNGGEELEGDPVILGTATISSDSTWVGNSSIIENSVWTFTNNAVVTLKGPITIKSGSTLELKGYGGFKRHDDCTAWMFVVEQGAQLLINGTSETQPITIDGNNVIASTGMISTAQNLYITNGVIKNGKNRDENGAGGGIVVTSTGHLKLTNSVVTKNTASVFGGGIYCSGKMEIKDSEISYNRAMASETGGVNKGRGGGFLLNGASATGTLENVLITHNAAMYYGGGGQVSSKAALTMSGNTVFSYNEAILHGAGALHVTDDATFTMDGGTMEYNTAQTVGGAIHSSYTCVLNLNAGQILNNTANGRGGGINVNTGGTITLGSGLTISGNKAANQAAGSSAIVDATGDSWSNVKYGGNHSDNGYGGALCLDSAECVVAGAKITDNEAAVGGGAIALVMINASVFDHIQDLKCLNFKMTSGEISGNTTAGNGAGVYMMSNKIDDNLHENYDNNSNAAYTYEAAKAKLASESLLTDIPVANISGGTIKNNIASGDGGGLYLETNTKFVISGTGDVSSNQAVNGAGVYIASGSAEIHGGTMRANEASQYGGALYIQGNVLMTNGTIGGDAETDANTAVNGGALYVTNGNVTIKHGSINGNKAVGNGELQDTTNNTGRGGAVYLAGDTNTLLTMESGTMNENSATNDGGAIYSTGGTILIGLENCSTEAAGAECAHHTALGDGRHHPVIYKNAAGDTGGGIALTDGVVRFYCGQAKDNQALYKGVGKNVFMDGGKFYLYDGADVGIPRDPDLVIVGGELYNECVTKEYYNLYYYYSNADTETQMVGLAEYQEIMNLPDGGYFWGTREGYVFLGWTAQGAASGNLSNEYVRNKEQYVASGEPVEILDAKSSETDQTAKNTNRLFDGTSDKTLHLYALWAPEKSDITYVNGLNGETILNTDTDPDNPAVYTFSRDSNEIQIQPVKHAGYDLVGWYIYQDANQNANWNNTLTDTSYEPVVTGDQPVYMALAARNGVLNLEAGNTNFGNITLIAKFVPAYTDLRITKTGWQYIDENQTFVFRITGDPSNDELDSIDMTVTIKGNGEVLIKDLPVGDYMVTEDTNWSWRYTTANKTQEVHLVDSSKTEQVDFANTRSNIYWLSGDSYCTNWWGGDSGTKVEKRVTSN